MGHHFYDMTFCLDIKKYLLYITWALCLDSLLNCLLIEIFFKKFIMNSSTWNVNVFKVSNPFHVYK